MLDKSRLGVEDKAVRPSGYHPARHDTGGYCRKCRADRELGPQSVEGLLRCPECGDPLERREAEGA